MDTLSTKPKTTVLYFGPTLHSEHPKSIQPHTHAQHHPHQVQQEVQYQELDQHGVSAKKHEKQGGAAYTSMVSPHDKPQVRWLYRSRKDRATLVQAYECSPVEVARAHWTHRHTNPQKTQYPVGADWLTRPSTSWLLLAYYEHFPKDHDVLGSTQSQHEPYSHEDQKRHGQWVKRVPVHTQPWKATIHVHYEQLHSKQTPPKPTHHPNHPMKEPQHTSKSAQQICETFQTVHQSTDGTRKTNQPWYLTWPSKWSRTQTQISGRDRW